MKFNMKDYLNYIEYLKKTNPAMLFDDNPSNWRKLEDDEIIDLNCRWRHVGTYVVHPNKPFIGKKYKEYVLECTNRGHVKSDWSFFEKQIVAQKIYCSRPACGAERDLWHSCWKCGAGKDEIK